MKTNNKATKQQTSQFTYNTHIERAIDSLNVKDLPFIEVKHSSIIYDWKGTKTNRKINLLISRYPAIYFLYNQDQELIYIGETNDLLQRLAAHLTQSSFSEEMVFVKFFVMTNSKRYRIGFEQILIDKFRPKYQSITLIKNPVLNLQGQ